MRKPKSFFSRASRILIHLALLMSPFPCLEYWEKLYGENEFVGGSTGSSSSCQTADSTRTEKR